MSLTLTSEGGATDVAGGESRWAGTEKGVGGPATARMEVVAASLPSRTAWRAAEASRRRYDCAAGERSAAASA